MKEFHDRQKKLSLKKSAQSGCCIPQLKTSWAYMESVMVFEGVKRRLSQEATYPHQHR